MIFFRTLLSHKFRTLLKHQNHPSTLLTNILYASSITHPINSNLCKSFTLSSSFRKPLTSSAQFEPESDGSNQIEENKKKPLDVMFKEAVGLCEKAEQSESEGEGERELKKRLRRLEREVRRLNLKANSEERESPNKKDAKRDGDSKPKSLVALFRNKKDKKGDGKKGVELESLDKKGDGKKGVELESLMKEEPIVFKELSPDMLLFVSHLYKEGYFKDANFLPRRAFDVSCFDDSYGRDYIKFAAEKFGKDNQEIAKWLSGSDLKMVALFGCPTLSRKNIFSAKRLRTFFGIQEDTVCSKCVLKQSCKFVNQSVWKGDTKNLNLAVVMRVITLYALEAVHPQLVVPDELKASVSRLLKEVVNLSKTIS